MGGNSRDKLIIVGDGETAELAYDYFTAKGNFEVVGFTVESRFKKNLTLFGLPVVPLENLENYYPPGAYKAFVAISYTQLNRLRTRLYGIMKVKGYNLCSYISPNAYVSANSEIGENCFILEGVVVQRGAKIGNNVVVWSGSIIGHRSIIRDNCFVAAHTVIPGFCEIGENSFLGVNCCVVNNTKVACDCVIGAGAVVVSDTQAGKIYVGNPAKPLPDKTSDIFISGDETI